MLLQGCAYLPTASSYSFSTFAFLDVLIENEEEYRYLILKILQCER